MCKGVKDESVIVHSGGWPATANLNLEVVLDISEAGGHHYERKGKGIQKGYFWYRILNLDAL